MRFLDFVVASPLFVAPKPTTHVNVRICLFFAATVCVLPEGRLPAEELGPVPVAAAVQAPVPAAPESNFRVTIKIFEGKSSQPAASHLVLFDQGMIYDFDLTDHNTVTVFDPARNRVVLLNSETEIRANISTDDLTKMTAAVRVNANTDELRERLGMAAKVHHDAGKGEYSIQYGPVEYVTTTQRPGNPIVAREFARFADWASRLNIARKLGLPPFGRMSLNQRIAVDGVIPNELSLEFKQGLTTSRYRSTHELIEQISQADRKKIDEVGSKLALYRDVPLKEFR